MACLRFFRKRARKDKKGQNILKFGQICTKFENNLKKGSLIRTVEYTLPTDSANIKEPQSLGKNGYREIDSI